MPVSGFFTNQRLSNIYDGPSYQDCNAYLDITTADCPFRALTATACTARARRILLLRREPGNDRPEKVLCAERRDRLEAAQRLLLSAGLP